MEGAREIAPRATVALVGTPRIASAQEADVRTGGVSAIALLVPSFAAVSRGDYSPESLGALGRALGGSGGAALLFGRTRPGVMVGLDAFVAESNATRLEGALGVGAGLAAAVPDGEVEEGGLLALRFLGGVSLSGTSASAVQALGPFARVTEVRRGYVERVGGQRALDWLRESGRGAPEGSLLLAMIEGTSGSVIVRGVAGIEPTRGAIHVGEDVGIAERIAVGVALGPIPSDAVERACRRASAGLRGGAPHAAILVDTVGRSSRAALADAADFTRRFGEIPWVGIRAAAQIVGGAERPRIAQHTATLSLVYSAS